MYDPIKKGHVLQLLSFVLTLQLTLACKGCVELDEITFHRVPLKFNYSLVKFDIAFPYGDKHEAFCQLASQLQTIEPTVDEIMFAMVGVKDYGDKENSKIADKYKIEENAYPAILLFGDNLDKEIARFPTSLDVTTDNLKIFLKEKTKLYIGLPGCIYEFDQLVSGFTKLKDPEKKSTLLKAQNLSKIKEDDQNYTATAKMYLLYMEKVMNKGEQFLKDESERIVKLLEKGKISANKRSQLETKINILKSFESHDKNNETKDEL